MDTEPFIRLSAYRGWGGISRRNGCLRIPWIVDRCNQSGRGVVRRLLDSAGA